MRDASYTACPRAANRTRFAGLDRADPVYTVHERRFGAEDRFHGQEVDVANLQHRARLLAEERRDGIGSERVEVDCEPAAARERHLQHARGESAVGSIVIRHRPALPPQA